VVSIRAIFAGERLGSQALDARVGHVRRGAYRIDRSRAGEQQVALDQVRETEIRLDADQTLDVLQRRVDLALNDLLEHRCEKSVGGGVDPGDLRGRECRRGGESDSGDDCAGGDSPGHQLPERSS
jgi:hypothetical protein